ncbi:MAG: glycosyltransferase, partial [Anaerolineae bacterium]
MRVLCILHRFYPDFVGGTEQHALDLARELQRRGHAVAVFYRAPGPRGLRRGEWDGIPVYRAQAGPKVLEQLLSKYSWDGKLVFAGPTPSVGGSEAAGISFLQDHP